MLDFSGSTIIWEIVNFIVITAILYFLVFKPIVKRSEARAAEKARLMEELTQDREAAAEKLNQINTRLNNLDTEIDKIADEAYEHNKVLQAELLDATREEANQILQDALLEVRKEQFIDMKTHQSDLIDVILDISGETMRKVAPPDVHAALIEGLTKKIWDLGKSNMRQVQSIRESLTERQPTAYVTSAYPLTGEQELNLARTFSALVDNDVNIEVSVDDSLVSGVKVRIGDLILENSIASHLEKTRAEVADSLERVSMEYDR